MEKEDLVLLILVLLLVVAAVLTLLFGGERSRHGGYGLLPAPDLPAGTTVVLERGKDVGFPCLVVMPRVLAERPA